MPLRRVRWLGRRTAPYEARACSSVLQVKVKIPMCISPAFIGGVRHAAYAREHVRARSPIYASHLMHGSFRRRGIECQLNNLLLKHHEELGGVVLGYDNVCLGILIRSSLDG